VAVTTAATPAPTFESLVPGGRARLREHVPVNFVFIGYSESEVDRDRFLSRLPTLYRPVVRSRLPYGITEYLGLAYTYDYEVSYTSARYEDRFFEELTRLAAPAPLTEWQRRYNQQRSNLMDVTGNHLIDAPAVEEWLADHPPEGIDTRDYTLYFVNWFGRDDFLHHVYTKNDEPDPDTGYDFGKRSSRKLIAWGGTTPDDEENGLGRVRRVWFYDLSAGPEAWTSNWNVDDPDLPDLDADRRPDYRMPPIWEYATNGFRRPSALTTDLALVARFVGIDLLFTTSPLYSPEITPHAVPSSINLDVSTYEGWRGVDASARYVTPELVVDEISEIRPLGRIDEDNEDLELARGALRCYVLWLRFARCYPRRAYPAFGNLFVFNALRTPARRDDQGRVDYEAAVVGYATGAKLDNGGLLGYADDNYRDGTQSLVFAFVSPLITRFGYGLTTTMIHELGHHFGLSHPHDGFDYERSLDFGPEGRYLFAWSGSESNSVMSYIDLNWDFSQFDRDNMSRWMAAAYVNAANAVARDVLLDPDALQVTAALGEADEWVGRAQRALAEHDYPGAARRALTAYEMVLEAARAAGVAVRAASGVEVDPPRPRAGRLRNESTFVDYLGRRGHRARL
jgi:hypothetical protein